MPARSSFAGGTIVNSVSTKVFLDEDDDATERRKRMGTSEVAVAAVGVGEGVRVESDDRVQAEMAVIRTRGPERRLVVRGNAGKVLLHDGATGGAAVL